MPLISRLDRVVLTNLAVSWVAGSLVVLLATSRDGTAEAQSPPISASKPPPIQGRVLDEKGNPIAGAKVRLYRRDSEWSKRDPQVEETKSGPDGSFRFTSTSLDPGTPDRPNPARLVLIAEHPDWALGWKRVPNAPSFRGEIRLSEKRAERTITVTDAFGKPLAGVTVAVMGLGDPTSSSPEFRETIDLKPTDGPLAVTADAAGRARFPNLPPTKASFAANKPGFAETICFPEQNTIRLTPATTLQGTLTGPDGRPLSGVTIKLHTEFVWNDDFAKTDDRGHYHLEGLKARGWDMAAWQAGKVADGKYKLWIENQEYAVPTQSLVLEPNENRTLDLEAEKAGIIRIKVFEEGTNKRVPGVRVWGLAADGGRFDALTDVEGVATFHTLATKLTLSIASPPKGTFVDQNLMDPWAKDSDVAMDFLGGEETATLILPRIGGRLVSIRGRCVRPDGTIVTGVTVHAVPMAATPYPQARQIDATGDFNVDQIPAGRGLGLYAISEDGKFGAWMTTKVPGEGEPEQPINLSLRPTVTVEPTLVDKSGNRLPSREFTITPKPGVDLVFLRRTGKSDEQGRLRLDRIIPGLSYHVEEQPAVQQRLPGGAFKAPKAALDTDLILAPGEGE